MGDSQHDRTGETRRTIVGGRPRSRSQGRGNIPRGIEVLIKKASLDPAFRQLLLERRAEAARDLALDLAPAERAILEAVPEVQLKRMIENTRVPDVQRRAFLGQLGVAMLATLAAGCTPPTDQVEDEPTERVIIVEKGIRPDEKARQVMEQQTREAATLQSASTATPSPTPDDTPTTPPAANDIQLNPEGIHTATPREVSRGIRPDRP